MADSQKTVLITGCSPGGIGNALAREFHSKGLRVIATAGTAETIQDLADLGIKKVVERTGGGLDYLVNNAGRNYTVPAIEAEYAEIEAVYATNLFAVIRLCQTFMPLLRRSRGTIVQIGSVAGVVPYAFGSVYNASKAALHSYSGSLRVEVAPLGVHVITVVTGGVKSRISRVSRALAPDSAYKAMEADYQARQVHSQTVGMETKAYAQSVVKQVLAAEGWLWRTRTIWEGGAANTAKWANLGAMEAPLTIPDADLAAMTLAGSNMESAVARLKRRRSLAAQGPSSTAEPDLPSQSHVSMDSTTEAAPGSANGPVPEETLHTRASEEEPKSTSAEMNGQSFETVDSALGKSLSETDVVQHKTSVVPSALRQTINSDWHRNDTASGTPQNTSVALSKAGEQRGRTPSSKLRERAALPNTQSGWNQYQLLPKPSGTTKIKKDATPDQKARSANISEAMIASWARRRNNSSLTERCVSKNESVEIPSGQEQAACQESNSHGTQRKLFKGQHAIRSGSGHKFPGSALRKPISRNHVRINPSAKEVGQPPDTSGGPELDDPPMICKGDNGLINVFQTCVYPTAVASIRRYRDTVLSPESLNDICKQVAKDTINEKFVKFLQQTEYKLDRPQRKLVRRYVKSSFTATVNLSIKGIQKQMLKSQSMRQKPQAELSHPSIANALGSHTAEVGSLTQYQQECNNDPPGPGKVLETGHISQEDYPAEKTARSETTNEREAMQGHFDAIKKERAPRRCISCRAAHLKCVPLGTDCEACHKNGKSCTFRPVDLRHRTFLSSNQDPLATGRGESMSRGMKHRNKLSCAKRFESGPQPALFDTGLPNHQGIAKVLGPLPEVNESVTKDINFEWDSILHRHHGLQPLSSWQSPHLPTLQSQSAFNPEFELAMARATLSDSTVDRPYKSLKRGHIDFNSQECISILRALDGIDQVPAHDYPADTSSLYQQIKARLGQLSEEDLTTIVKAVSNGSESSMTARKKKSIRTFLVDLTNDSIPSSTQPKLAKPTHRVESRVRDSNITVSSFLRNRELGIEGRRGSLANTVRIHPQPPNIRDAVRAKVAEGIRPWKSWKGASSDVVVVAWAPDSLSYAAGAAAQSDDMDLQYNRPNNLLFGQLKSNTISELPDHRIDRPKPETIRNGPNSNQAVYDACDPVVYKTVTSVSFSPSGSLLYTASQDCTAKIWDVSGGGFPSCVSTLPHNAGVTSLEVSSHHPDVFATAANSIDDSIRVYQPLNEASGYQFTTLSSARALKHRSQQIFPECIRWGLAPGSQHLLLGGFQQWADQDFSAGRQGDICLWDVCTGTSIAVKPHVSSIFAAAWHPRENVFITGGAPGTGILSYPRVTQSVVRMYDARHTATFTAELECPALDMQDITFHPNSDYITAGCTDGITYVWDRRKPDYILHRLKHGDPLQELAANEDNMPHRKHRERVDAGIMLSIWGQGASLFYTGSSDGIIKAWDVLRGPEDVWIRDIAQLPAGVQSGALSPDGMNMLVGDAVGGVHVLSAAPSGPGVVDDWGVDCDPDPITYVAATSHSTGSVPDEGTEGTEGIQAGNELLRSQQLVLHPSYGVGKGPNYLVSNLAKYARWPNDTTGYWELRPEIDQKQAFNVNGVEQPEQSARIRKVIIARQEQINAKREVESLPVSFSFGVPTTFVANRRPSGTAATTFPIRCQPLLSRVAATAWSSPIKPSTNFIDLETYISPSQIPGSGNKRKREGNDRSPSKSSVKRIKAERASSVGHQISPSKKFLHAKTEVVDLTGDDDDDVDIAVTKTTKSLSDRQPRPLAVNLTKGLTEELEENLLSYQEWVEEDHWWPE
ncbi:MAG: hypothetical protein L6R36_002156 [Xanthoria steineri]|nr:MAG: hypothetical protein L6R36_002156 [Xanthoria steineri]